MRGAREHNLRDVDLRVPLGTFVAVTGVSGSGKSTLVTEVLYRALARELNGSREPVGAHDFAGRGRAHRQDHRDRPEPDRAHAALEPGDLRRPVHADPRAVRRRPRVAAAWLHAGPLQLQRQGRALRALQGRRHPQDRDAVPAGRLRAVRGLPRQALQPRGARDPLQGQVDRRRPRDDDRRGARVLLGRPQRPSEAPDAQRRRARATSTSASRRRRCRAARRSGSSSSTELSRRATGRTLYVLDEPTTGLHFADVEKLLEVLHRLVDGGNTVLVIEHNLDVIKTADWIVDLGPEGGDRGGRIIAEGTPEKVAKVKELGDGRVPRPRPAWRPARPALGRDVRGRGRARRRRRQRSRQRPPPEAGGADHAVAPSARRQRRSRAEASG